MERTTKMRLPITSETTPNELKKFLVQAAPNDRVRLKKDVLYCRPERIGGPLDHAKGHLGGDTVTKRQELWRKLDEVFKKDHINLGEHAKQVLLPHEYEKLRTLANGDLKVKHLLRIFEGTVKVDGKNYQYDRLNPFAAGAYGQIYRAKIQNAADGSELALKKVAKPTAKDEEALRQEVAVHGQARGAQVDKLNYVVETGALVVGHDGALYQPMAMAVCSADKLLDKFTIPEAENEVNSLVVLTLHDWIMSLYQINSVGLAHRDIKPENWLLSKEGIWQLSDFGTAGDNEKSYGAHQFKGYRVTGNGSVFAKAPEWLHSELPPDREDPDKFKNEPAVFKVGHSADVFSMGVAAFRLITRGKLPFADPLKFDDPSQRLPLESEYEEQVLAYRASGKLFSEWYLAEYGQPIPLAWRSFFDWVLHSDPQKRPSAGELLELPIFGYLKRMDVSKLRQELLQKPPSDKSVH
jgi:serine/threonine protein kinase